MDDKKRYHALENMLTTILFGCLGFFVLYLISAGMGIAWLKALAAIVALGGCCFMLSVLVSSKEVLKQRSLWLTCAAGGIILCTLTSLALRFPG